MGAAVGGHEWRRCVGKRFKERTSDDSPIGAASCQQQYNQALCQPPHPGAMAVVTRSPANPRFH